MNALRLKKSAKVYESKVGKGPGRYIIIIVAYTMKQMQFPRSWKNISIISMHKYSLVFCSSYRTIWSYDQMHLENKGDKDIILQALAGALQMS